MIGKYTQLPKIDFSTKIVKKRYGEAYVKEKVDLFAVLEDLSVPIRSNFPLNMEMEEKKA